MKSKLENRKRAAQPTAPSASGLIESRKQTFIACLVLAVLTLILYWPVREFEFINYDDDVFVYRNGHVVQGLTTSGIWWAFTSADIDYWRPLSWISHMVDVELFGLNAGGHHLVSLLFHIANTVLLFLFLKVATNRHGSSFFVAGLFAWHPLHVESVVWIAERKDVLCAFFWFLALWCYTRYAQSNSKKFYVATLVSFFFGLMSKPMIVTLPFLLPLLDIWPLRRFDLPAAGKFNWRVFVDSKRNRKLFLEKVPFFVGTAIFCFLTFTAQGDVGAMVSTERFPIIFRFANSVLGYGLYVAKIFWPINLAVFYPMKLPPDWVTVFVVMVGLVSVSILAVRNTLRLPFVFVGWAWFLGILVPVIGLVQVGNQAMADRYSYVSAIGIFMALTWLLSTVRDRKPCFQKAMMPAAILVLLGCCITARFQIQHWRNGISLFEHALSVTRGNYVAMNNLANNLDRAGRLAEALPLYAETVRLGPGSPRAHYNYAVALEKVDQKDQAYAHYEQVIAIDPNHANARNNLATLLTEKHRLPEAIQQYQLALKINPKLLEAWFNLAGTWSEMGKTNEAISSYQKLLEIDPRQLDARVNLTSILSECGRHAEALKVAQAGLIHDPGSVDSHFNIAMLSQILGDLKSTTRHLGACLQLNPQHLPARLKLAWLLAASPQPDIRSPDTAIELARVAERQFGKPAAQTLDVQSIAFAAKGDFQRATQLAEQAGTLARQTGNQKLAAEIETRRKLFLTNRSFQDVTLKAGN